MDKKHPGCVQTFSVDELWHEPLCPKSKAFLIVGGPQGDTGLTGRKIIVDSYGGMGRHGGDAFLRPIYSKTTNYGHFGKIEDLDSVTWERTDKAAALKRAVK